MNFDFLGNLGHSIERRSGDRIYIEKGNKKKLSEVSYFTFEPHISKGNSEYGYKWENIYYSGRGEIKGIIGVFLLRMSSRAGLYPFVQFKTKGEWIAAKRDVTFVWRKMEHKQPIKISGKAVLTAVVGIVGALALGVGMCFTMVWGNMILGIVVGLVGIVILICLIPLCKGLK